MSDQVGSDQVISVRVMSVQVWSVHFRSGQTRSCQVRPGYFKSGQVRSDQVRSSLVWSGQIRSGQVVVTRLWFHTYGHILYTAVIYEIFCFFAYFCFSGGSASETSGLVILYLSLLCFFTHLLQFYSGGAVDLWSCFHY